ncbi:hypothetical protein V493_02465 [Pseudogymnoascus sp. VKM F-4281 (FW-2241)]|nr:hypothetical protein V493_02465 [Pseudogymnoascus sp. VKM F-4281 (FW-2241)]
MATNANSGTCRDDYAEVVALNVRRLRVPFFLKRRRIRYTATIATWCSNFKYLRLLLLASSFFITTLLLSILPIITVALNSGTVNPGIPESRQEPVLSDQKPPSPALQPRQDTTTRTFA